MISISIDYDKDDINIVVEALLDLQYKAIEADDINFAEDIGEIITKCNIATISEEDMRDAQTHT